MQIINRNIETKGAHLIGKYHISHSKAMRRVFYGWFIVAVCMLMIFGASLVTTGLSVGLRALRDEMGFSGTETSIIFTICSVAAFFSILFADRYFDKLGLRLGMFIGVLFGMIDFIIYSMAGSNFYLYCLGSVFGGFNYGLCFMLSTSMVMRRWFNDRRALALSICSAGSGFSILIGTPILELIIEDVSLQMSFVVEAIFMATVAILIFLIVRDDPSMMGLEPLGGKDFVVEHKAGRNYHMTGKVVTLLFIAALLGGICGSPATSNFALNFTNVGLNETVVAFAISVFGLMLLISKLAYGNVVDRKGAYFSTMLFGLFIVIGQLGCFMVGHITADWFMFLTLAIMGMGYPIISLGYPNWSADFTSKEEYPKMLKRLQLGYQFGIMAGSPVPGIIADATGSFTWAYLMFGVLLAISLLMVHMAYGNATERMGAASI